jgi:hypothetical protein
MVHSRGVQRNGQPGFLLSQLSLGYATSPGHCILAKEETRAIPTGMNMVAIGEVRCQYLIRYKIHNDRVV